MDSAPVSDKNITIAVDVMGSDRGVKTMIRGLASAKRKNPRLCFRIFGRAAEINKALSSVKFLSQCSVVVDCADVVDMNDKPSQVMRHGKNTSMYAALQAVKSGDAAVAVSCGNTGALMALSMLVLRKAPQINRPAIACLWPSRSQAGYNIMLDAGADIRADADDLVQYAIMGTIYARAAFGLEQPRLGILNVGTEHGKGRPELQEASEKLDEIQELINADFKGFVEGPALVGNQVDVIVTDGFTGNVALKTGEGAARFMGDMIKETFTRTPLSRISTLFVINPMRRLRKKFDPRRSNGGVFLGLGGTVIKSHGSSDALALSSAIKLAFNLADGNFHSRVSNRLEQALSHMKGQSNE